MQEFDPHVLDEKPIPPPAEFAKKARVRSMDEYEEMCAKAAKDPKLSGAKRPRISIGSSRRRKLSNGKCRTRNGLSVAS